MRILVIGGSGFLGKPVIEELIAGGHEIMALSRSASTETNSSHSKIRWIRSSLLLEAGVLQELTGFTPEVIVDLAWEKIPDFSFDVCLENLQSQLSFFKNVLTIPSVKKVIVAGSCFEYNKKQGACIESEQTSSGNYFTWAKNSLRDFLQFECLQKNITLAWARIFYVYGPGQRSAALIPAMISSFQQSQAPDIRTPGNANDFIYVTDVADGFRKLTEKEIASGIYNFGSGKATPVTEILSLTEKIIRNNDILTKQVLQSTAGTTGDIDFYADIKKAHGILGWKPETSIEEGIRKMVAGIN